MFRAPIGNAALSYGGVIVLGDEIENTRFGVNTLNHEYGHYLHMKEIGIESYTITVAIPSLAGATLQTAGMLSIYYYDQPWEYIADMYGGVDRGRYASSTPSLSKYYYYSTKIVGILKYLP